MKKIILSLVFMATSATLFAQANIQNTMQIGYAMPIQIASTATAATVPIGTSGNGVTWDCSNLVQEVGTPTINFNVVSTAGTPYVSDYPSANWCFTDPALAAQVGYSYHQLTTDSFMFWGAHKSASAYEIYDNPEVVLVFPFAYNQSVTNSYSKTNYTAAGGVSSYQTGDITITYEGFGTLMLPGATYTSVAKVKSVRTNSLGPTTTSYMWYNTSNGERLLTYDGVSGNQVIYRSGTPMSVNTISSKNTIECQNHASNLVIKSMSKLERVQLVNVTGQVVYSNSAVAQNDLIIGTQEFPRGIYMVVAKSANQTKSFKVALQ